MNKQENDQVSPKQEAINLCASFKAIGCQNEVAAALISVNKIISVYNMILPPPGTTYSLPGRFFWQQVKSELEKMEREP